MNTITFECETITPMFISGANQQEAELRPPSIKGAMRFWWRAAYWGRHKDNAELEKMSAREGEIFGTSNDGGRKSAFSLQVRAQGLEGRHDPLPNQLIQVTSKGRSFKINILEYLAYGTLDYNKEKRRNDFNRDYLPAGTTFELIISTQDETIKSEVLKSFALFARFGGLGAKSRNGFGCFAVTQSLSEYMDLKTLKTNLELPAFSAFSSQAKLFKLMHTCKSWDECLGQLGIIYREARGNLERKHDFQKRQYIGAPIVADKQQKSFLDRHGKPYFLHVQKTEKGYDGYILYLASKYCDGIDKSAARIPADAEEKFKKYCGEFNTLLQSKMEEVTL